MNKLRQLLPKSIKQIKKEVKSLKTRVEINLKSIHVQITSKPIFILGNQKSGTTAISELLANMVDLSISRDLRKEIKTPNFHLVRKGDMSLKEFISKNKLDFSRDIIKEPNLTLLYPHLIEYFPEAKFVFVLRDPRDNIRSILNRLNFPGNLSHLNEEHQESITPAWKLILDSHWLGFKGENYVEMLAYRWNLLSDIFLENQDYLVLTRYEDFLRDKRRELERIAERLDLCPVNDITDKLDIQFQQFGNRSSRNSKWMNFFGEENLARIENICGEKMAKLGYQNSV